MRFPIVPRFVCAVAAVALAACGSSPTEPTSSNSSGPQTTLRVVVTKCDLGGSVTVHTELGVLGTLQTPGDATFSLPPGPHNLWWQRGNENFGGSPASGILDLLGTIPSGSTASITLMDPPGACLAMPSH
jgi:hypothetical protein